MSDEGSLHFFVSDSSTVRCTSNSVFAYNFSKSKNTILVIVSYIFTFGTIY